MFLNFNLFLTLLAYYSQIAKKDIYLNSGLTSTKNYGKTILTKVEEVFSSYVCAGDVDCVPWDCDKLLCSPRKELLPFHLSQISGDKDIDHKTKIIILL